MSYEHDRAHDRTASDAGPHADPSEPGRASHSQLLRKPATAVPSGILARKPRDANGVAEGADHAVAAAASSSGSALPGALMRKFEASLGADLSGVRVHTGDTSAAANDAVGAKAYTLGQDIHFGAGHYDPSSPAGEHLLAHEVAHTVQQAGGAQRMQFQLAVSSPGDHLEHEADRAANAMVIGRAAIVTAAKGVARKELGVSNSGKISVSVGKHSFSKIDCGPISFTPSLSGKLTFKKMGSSEAGAEPPVGLDVSAGPDKVALSADSKLGEEHWGVQPKITGGVELTKTGPKLSLGLAMSHKSFSLSSLTVGPFAVSANVFQWEAGALRPKILFLDVAGSISAPVPGSFMGYAVTPELKCSVSIEPNWDKLGEWLAEQAAAAIASGAAGAAGAIAAPMIAAAGMLFAWSKAGHEFDEVQSRIEGLRARCQAATQEAMTFKHAAVELFGKDANAGTSTLASEIRAALCAQLALPEAALPEALKLKPDLRDVVYRAAWSKTWPGLRAQLMESYKDTTFKSYKFERMWLESFDTGSFAKSAS